MYACKHEDARRMVSHGQYDILLKTSSKNTKLWKAGVILCCVKARIIRGYSSAFEFDFNAGVANDLGCPIIAVVNGRGKSPEEVIDANRFARDAFESQGCTILAILANRVEPQNVGLIKARLKERCIR